MGSERLHEDLSRQTEEERSSERSLGLTFAAVLALIGAVKLYRGNDWGLYWLAAALPFLACAFLWQAPLRPLNLIWHRFGLLLFHVVNPIVMAIVFYATVVPIGLLLRLVGKDPLRLKLDREAASYWLERKPPGPVGSGMKNQF